MATDTVAGPLAGPRRMVQREAGRWWWIPLIVALVWFVIAWLVLRADYTSLATVGVLVGIVFLFATVTEVAVAAIGSTGWRIAHSVLAILFLLAALWSFIRPVNTFFALASMLGLLLFLQGIFYLARGVALRDETPYWWLDLVSGGLLTALAIWVSTSDRVWTLSGRAAFILLWVGFMAIFRGFNSLLIAFSLRRLARGELPAAAGVLPEDAVIPPQDRRAAAAQHRQPTTPS
jgi:uncharacterized membrane protein HdeD (DUF308 family)